MSTYTHKLLVIGSINIDLVGTGENLPLPGETLAGIAFSQTFGGKGANQAAAAARAGAQVDLINPASFQTLEKQLENVPGIGIIRLCFSKVWKLADSLAASSRKQISAGASFKQLPLKEQARRLRYNIPLTILAALEPAGSGRYDNRIADVSPAPCTEPGKSKH